VTDSDPKPDDTVELTASQAMWYSGALPEAALLFAVFYVLIRIVTLPFRLLARARRH
jgi:hypothetical protein